MAHRIALSLALALAAASTAQAKAPPERLNIISIVTDDQAAWSIGAYGNRESRTPNMDRLARQGALFRNAFVATPVCSPSRLAFLTSRYGTELGITDWITPEEARAGIGLPPGTTTWPRVLQQNGYTTALIGKWHLGALPQFHPTQHGFDYFFGFLAGGTTPMDPTLEENGREKKLNGPCPDILTDSAIQFVEANRTRPFALLLHFREPHMPYGPVPEEDAASFRNLDPTVPDSPGANRGQVKGWMRDYYASIHAVDRNLGRLLAKLDELGLAQKTIVLFTSDHGYMIGHHGLHTKGNAVWISGPDKNKKRPNMFEDSIRVPLIIRWPGVTRPGVEIQQTVCNLDTFPTVLGMLNISPPKNLKQHSLDFSPLLRGKRINTRDALFGQYDLHNGGRAYMRMIRTDEWKLVRHFREEGSDEFYDLKTDPGETNNLYDNPQFKKVQARLQSRLTKWQQTINDPLLRTAQ